MKYNSPHSTAALGAMAKDWEQGIDYTCPAGHGPQIAQHEAVLAVVAEAVARRGAGSDAAGERLVNDGLLIPANIGVILLHLPSRVSAKHSGIIQIE